MIIVKLMGGLGNQMFQYAAGRSLAHLHGTELRLDHSFFELSENVATPRQYELHHFNVSGKRSNKYDFWAIVTHRHRWHILLKALWPLLRRDFKSIKIIQERLFDFDPSFFDFPDNIQLAGYWQSEKYFSDIADIIRKEFTVRSQLTGENQRIANVINSSTAVSLHVRRGDYVSCEKTAAVHGACSLEYYDNAIERIANLVSAPHFFIFSDDIAWVKKHLHLDYPVTIVGHNSSENGCEDLRLMSFCRHHIIANSSFSWWGAWLNPQPDKIVIAPARWFSDTTIDTSDLIPESWIRISL